MKIAVMSDTHDHVENTKKAIKQSLDEGVERFIHAGDLCSPFMVKLFKNLKLDIVKGNNDADIFRIMNLLEKNQYLHDELLVLEIKGLKIGVYHGTTQDITIALRNSDYDILITGHTHIKKQEIVNNCLHLNPGSVHGFDKEASFAILDLKNKEIQFHQI